MLRLDYDELEPSEDYLDLNYNGKPFTGIAFELDQQGELLSETSYVNGQKDGVDKEWSPTGVVVREQYFACGALNGSSREWHGAGNLKTEAEYELGICLWEKEWTNDGHLVRDFVLKDDNPQFAMLRKLRKITKN